MEEIHKRVGFMIERSYRAIKMSYLKMFDEAGVDLTPNQFVMLDVLQQEGGSMLQRSLTSKTLKDPPTASRMIETMVKRGLVSRNTHPEDRRKTIISITDEGAETVDKCMKKVSELRTTIWQNLNEEDFNQLSKILEQINTNLD